MKLLMTPTLIAAAILFNMLNSNPIGAQSVTVREHKKVATTSKSRLLIIRQSGESLKGIWQMEISDAICLKTKYGREVIIPKSDISEIYRCRRMTNVGFFYGFMVGFTTPFLVGMLIDEDLGGYIAPASAIGIGGGLVGAVIGSLIDSCEPIELKELAFSIAIDKNHGSDGVRLQFNYAF